MEEGYGKCNHCNASEGTLPEKNPNRARTDRAIPESDRGKERIAFRADLVDDAQKQDDYPANNQAQGRRAGP